MARISNPTMPTPTPIPIFAPLERLCGGESAPVSVLDEVGAVFVVVKLALGLVIGVVPGTNWVTVGTKPACQTTLWSGAEGNDTTFFSTELSVKATVLDVDGQ